MSRRSTGRASCEIPCARLEHFRQSARVIGWVRRTLGDGSVAGGGDKGGELPVGDGGLVNQEATNRDFVDRRFFRIMAIGPHMEGTAGDPPHAGFR
jgi:hypothetical protein